MLKVSRSTPRALGLALALLTCLGFASLAEAANTQFLPAYKVLTVTAVGSAGTLERLADEPAAPTPTASTSVSLGTSVARGPFGSGTWWRLSASLTHTITDPVPAIVTAADGTMTIGGEVGAEAIVFGDDACTSITLLTDGGDLVFDGTVDGVAPAGITADVSAGTWTFAKSTSGVAAIIGADDSGAAGLLLDTTGAGAIDIGSADVTDIQFSCDGGSVDFGTTASTFVFTALTTADAVIMGADAAGAANTTFDTTGAGAITYGSADVTSHTFTSDGTGTGEVVLPTGSVAAAEILDLTRTVNIPITTLVECSSTGAVIGFDATADALPDFACSATDGLGCSLTFDDTSGTEDTAYTCGQLVVPDDYAAGGVFVFRVTKDAQTAGNTELLTVQISNDAGALETAGTTAITTNTIAEYTVTPTIAGIAAGESLGFTLRITSGGTMDDVVNIWSMGFEYTATQ